MAPKVINERVRDISEQVYRYLLEKDGTAPNRSTGEIGDVARMIEKDGDQGQKLRNRAASYDRITRAYMHVLGVKE